MTKEGFEPIAGKTARVLILGTFPGEESLRQSRYYAHPRNQFWEVIAAICGAGTIDDYGKRCELAKGEGIAVWDVIKSCDREGSADEKIKRGRFIPNDIGAFLAKYPVGVIFFNGTKAAQLFKRYVAPTIPPPHPRLVILPSTSPAHAALSRQQKLERWLEVRTFLEVPQQQPVSLPVLPESPA